MKYRNEKNAAAIAALWHKNLESDNKWFEVKSQTPETAEVLIYDVIGWPFLDANAFLKTLSEINSEEIVIRVNSPGGDVWDAMAIYNALISHKSKIITRIESLAASAASFVVLAGNEVQAYPNAMLMIHDPWVLIAGNQYDLRETADVLDKISGNMVDIYSGNSKLGKKEIRSMMKEETWLTAKEAKNNGFIDTILEGKAAKAKFDLSIYNNVPEDIKKEVTPSFVERILREAGFSRSEAKALLARGWQGLTNDKVEAAESLLAKLQNLTSQIRAALTHNSKLADDEPDWGDIDKTKLPRNAFAGQGEPDKKSTWSYPHHWVKNGKVGDNGIYVSGDMYLHKGGLNAAWAAAQGARTGKKASSDIIAHLEKHRKAIGE